MGRKNKKISATQHFIVRFLHIAIPKKDYFCRPMKRVIIIGAGISGLTAAVYARRSGFEVVVLEKAGNPGGISTNWCRKGYTFEGGVHWLIGAKEEVPLHAIWKETGALQENNPVYYKDPVYTLVDDAGQMPLRRDLKELEITGLRDKIALALLRFHLACFRHFHTPIQDMPGLKSRYPRGFHPMEFVKMLPAVILTPSLLLQSATRYAKRFRNPRIRTLLSAVVDPRINALSLIYTLSTFTAGDSGYPQGGSLKMAQNMADCLTSLGGEIRYHTPALSLEKEGDVVRVQTADETLQADAVIISMDARKAIDNLFGHPLQERWAQRMRQNLKTTQCMFIGLGVKTDLSAYPRSMQLVLPRPFTVAGITYKTLIVNNYAKESSYAPPGCTVLTCLLHGDSYDYWATAKADGSYAAKKQETVALLIDRLADRIPEVKTCVEVTDMATPLTYERYCDTFQGSYMSHWEPLTRVPHAPMRFAHGIYFTGQRVSYSGGLPPAAESGYRSAQTLCKDFGMEFVSR